MLLLPCLLAFLAIGQDLHSCFTVKGQTPVDCVQTNSMTTPGVIDHIDSSAPKQNSNFNSDDPSISWKSDATNAWIAVSFKTTQRVWMVQLGDVTGVSKTGYKITLFKNGVGTPVYPDELITAQRASAYFLSNPLADTVKIELVPSGDSTTVSVRELYIRTCPSAPCNQTDFIHTPGAMKYVKSSAPDSDQNSNLIYSLGQTGPTEPVPMWTSNATNPWITISFPTTKLVTDVYFAYVDSTLYVNATLLKNGVEVDSKQFSTNTAMIGANYASGVVADTVKLEFAKHPYSPKLSASGLVINTCESPQPPEEASGVGVSADEPSEGSSDVPPE